MSLWIPVATLVALSVLHSLLGEWLLLRPLFAAGLGPTPLGRWFAQRTLRFAWHLTSVAWLGLALIAARGDRADLLVVGGTLLVSAFVTGVASRGRHFAWALFAVGGAAALLGREPARVAPSAGALAALVLGAVALLHLGWAVRARGGLEGAVPTLDGRPLFVPSRALTVAVAVLFGGAGALVLYASRTGVAWACVLSGLGALVLAARAIGDFRFVGLCKRERRSLFARWDDALYTPLCVVLAVCFALVGLGGGVR